jgi:hypothetical protein
MPPQPATLHNFFRAMVSDDVSTGIIEPVRYTESAKINGGEF